MSATESIEALLKSRLESINMDQVNELARENSGRMSQSAAMSHCLSWGDTSKKICDLAFDLSAEIEKRDIDNDPLVATWQELCEIAGKADLRRAYYDRLHVLADGYID